LNPERYRRQPLIDYLIAESEKGKRIVLYSEAQLWKSTELKQLAHETQASELFNTILFELRFYTGGSLLDNSKLAYLLNESSKRSLLILDGLDEVKDELRLYAINQIEYLSAEYPKLSIVVSCRANFESTNEI
jgi:predicted NACHT family NTPase